MSRNKKNLQNLNKEFDKWIPDYVTSESTSGSCGSNEVYGKDNIARLDTGSTPPPNQSYDYYHCGGKDEDGRGTCVGMTDTVWNSVWENCKPSLDSKKNKDKCVNIPRIDQVQDNFNVGFRTNCNDDAKYNPVTNTCSKDCGVDSKCKIPDGNYGGHRRPAYPIHIPRLEAVADTLGKGRRIETDKGPQYTCPSTHPRQFSCAGDGYPNALDDVPGCGQGEDIDDLEDPINFCARATKDYDVDKLIGCCLSNKPGLAEGSISEENPKNTCPVGYCRSHLSYEGSSGHESASDKCKKPFTSGGKMGCYAMSHKCNTMFKEYCTSDIFLNAKTANEKKRQIACKKRAKGQPLEFNDIAKDICSLPKANEMRSVQDDGEESEGFGESDARALATKMKGRGGRSLQRQLVALFTSNLCRDYIMNNIIDNVSVLRKLCEPAVKKEGDKWVKTEYGKNMGDICPCYLPNEYYDWYKEEKLSQGGKVESSIMAQTKPWCFDMDCTATMLFPDNYSDCPDIQTCINEIKQKVTVAGGGRDRMTMPSGREISAGSQSCNFNAINSGSSSPPPVGAPQSSGITGAAAGRAAFQASQGQAGYGTGAGAGAPGYGGYAGYGVPPQAVEGQTDKMIQAMGIFFGILLVAIGVGFAVLSGGNSKKGE